MNLSTAESLPADFWASAKRRAVRGTEGRGSYSQTEMAVIQLLSQTVARLDYPARLNQATETLLEIARLLAERDKDTEAAERVRKVAEVIEESALARSIEKKYTIVTDGEVGEQSLFFGVIVQGRDATLALLRAKSNTEVRALLRRAKYFSVK